MAFKIFLSSFYNLSRREKSVARPSVYPQLPRPSVRKRQLCLIPYSKVIDLTNYELRISNYQLIVYSNSFGNVMVF